VPREREDWGEIGDNAVIPFGAARAETEKAVVRAATEMPSLDPASRHDRSRRGTVLVFARSPVRGEVKTRIARVLGAGPTLRLYRSFLQDTLELARLSGAAVVLAHTPGPAFPELKQADVVFMQEGDSEGKRFDHALATAFTLHDPPEPLVIIGSDTPHLEPDPLRSALDRLTLDPCVLGPSPDGGFYLLGFAGRPLRMSRAFADPGRLANVARELLDSGGIRVHQLESLYDIDRPEDVVLLADELRRRKGHAGRWVPPATCRALDSMAPSIDRLREEMACAPS
jgi:uncharacterized protein